MGGLEYGDTGVPHREDQNCLLKANYAKAKFRAGKYIKDVEKFKFDYLILRLLSNLWTQSKTK